METFDVEQFLACPTQSSLDSCKKDELLQIATSIGLSLSRQLLKKTIKNAVVEKLVELNMFSLQPEVAEGVEVSTPSPMERDIDPAMSKMTLPHFQPFSPQGSEVKGDIRHDITSARLEMEQRERTEQRQADFELKLAIRRMELELDREIRLRELELRWTSPPIRELKQTNSLVSGGPEQAVPCLSQDPDPSLAADFPITKHIGLVPPFREAEIDSYFSLFERMAVALKWPKDLWTLLLQSKLVGKAQEVCSSLSLQDSMNYETVKGAILGAYELVPEAYRQRFRTFKKTSSQTYIEFAREKTQLFDKWLAAQKVNTFEALRELMLLEDFKSGMPDKLVLHLNELKIISVSQSAIMADEFVLLNRTIFVPKNKPATQPEWKGESERAATPILRPASQARVSEAPECFYCHKRGHIVANCQLLLRKKVQKTSNINTPVALASSSPEETADSLTATCYQPFTSQGKISVKGSDPVEIVILRDTGAAQSLVRANILPFSVENFCDSYILCQGFEMSTIKVPLHYVNLESQLVSGEVRVGVRPVLPIMGIDFILGNDLAGEKVMSSVEVTDKCVDCKGDNWEKQYPDIFTHCVMTRSQSKYADVVDLSDSFMYKGMNVEKGDKTPVFPFPKNILTKRKLIEAQKNDPSLGKYFEMLTDTAGFEKGKTSYFLEGGVLVRRWCSAKDCADSVLQVVVPVEYRSLILALAHDHPCSGHLGITKTYSRILQYFFWPKLRAEIKAYCSSCDTCQKVGKPNQVIPPAPLYPIPVMKEPFEKILIDCVGPLPKTKAGNQFLLTIMCTATRFPEAIPLRRITTPVVVKALTKYFTTFGLPKVIQTDQGTNFTSKLFSQVVKMLGIQHVLSSSYHPQSQGAIERFHQTLKNSLKKYCVDSGREWDEGVPLVMFALREAEQEALGFSPAQLVFGHTLRGPLKLLKEHCLNSDETVLPVSVYVSTFRSRWAKACEMAKETLKRSQGKMKSHFDKKVVKREFNVGDKVLVLLPTLGGFLSSKFTGPHNILRKLSETNYVVSTPERRRKERICHINMLKLFQKQDSDKGRSVLRTASGTVPVAVVQRTKTPGKLDPHTRADFSVKQTFQVLPKFENSQVWLSLRSPQSPLNNLDEAKKRNIIHLLEEFPTIFGDVPTQTHVLMHDIKVTTEIPLKSHPYRVNQTKREIMKKEVDYLSKHGFAIPSKSPWSSPCLLVTKADGTVRFCTDYRKLNDVTVSDSYPLPRIDDCIDTVGGASFVTKLDLLKGYWQIPLTARASELSAFVTPDNFLQYTVMAFGLKNAPATFQRLMNTVLANIPRCTAYLDDVVVYSEDWQDHINTLRQVFERMRDATLTVNLAKCEFAQATITYLGMEVGHGKVRPVNAKVQAVINFPPPRSRKELRRFLGMAGYYRGFCKNFAIVATPLTNLLSVNKVFKWSKEAQDAFDKLKEFLCCEPVLAAPNPSKSFKLEIDASQFGAGAVLIQEDEHGTNHPVSYFSRKFNKHQVNYSTIEREALALVLALQHFEVYVGATPTPVIVYTDHNPLVFLNRVYNQNQRLMRWSLILQGYHLQMRHKKGKENKMADALSRCHTEGSVF